LFKDGQPLDARRYFIIIPDALGRGGSSKPSDGLKGNFPHYRYHDMVDSTHRLVTEGLNVAHLRLVIGSSLGCMHSFSRMRKKSTYWVEILGIIRAA
jgi:homoserine O-acetyltransferase